MDEIGWKCFNSTLPVSDVALVEHPLDTGKHFKLQFLICTSDDACPLLACAWATMSSECFLNKVLQDKAAGSIAWTFTELAIPNDVMTAC